ncbi:MAG: hypothetical protein IVW56_03475 [Candidatus Binataceae bacterium]|nr:hypothetical protein [Candidatus Binataceae bacterium]
MAIAPEETVANSAGLARKHFPGELEGDYAEIMRRVELIRAPGSALRRLARAIVQSLPLARQRRRAPDSDDRHVAFDGFARAGHEDKLERDRRYGTVYRVTEARNAYLVRLEMPRRTPYSALKQAWKLPDEMPAYDYTISLGDDFLAIRAGLRGEAIRRAAYVSPSFPSQFLTRIEFAQPVAAFKHRMEGKLLEVIVFKRAADAIPSAA